MMTSEGPAASFSRGMLAPQRLSLGQRRCVLQLRPQPVSLPSPLPVSGPHRCFSSHTRVNPMLPLPRPPVAGSLSPFRVWRALHTRPLLCAPRIPFLLADIGEGITEVEILQWYVKEGQTVSQFDKICEVQSDKATVEITSRYDGTVVGVHYRVGDVAKVGKPLCTIDTEGASAPENSAEAPVPASATDPSPAAPPGSVAEGRGLPPPPPSPPDAGAAAAGIWSSGFSTKVRCTPAVRRLARDAGIDLRSIRGSGLDGRILAHDLHGGARAVHPASVGPAPADIEQSIPVRGLTRTMVKTMDASLMIPHLGLCDAANIDSLLSVRDLLKKVAADKGVEKLTLMPFLVKAASRSLLEYPELNSGSVDRPRNVSSADRPISGAHNIGIAVDSPTGLIVPTIKNCQTKSVLDIAQELNRLIDLARHGRLGKGDLSGGTFSLSNIGAISGTYARPLIVPPEVAIGAFGRTQTVPRWSEEEGRFVKTNVMPISWSADGTVVDLIRMSRFSQHFVQQLEEPMSWLLELK